MEQKTFTPEEIKKKYGIGGTETTSKVFTPEEIKTKFGIDSTVSEKQTKTGMQKASDTLGAIFGGKQIGEAIGTNIARARATPEEREFITPGPSTSQVVGDIGRSALNFIPVGKIAGGVGMTGRAAGLGKLAKPIAQIGTGAGIGYAGDVTTKIAEGSERPFERGAGTTAGALIGGLPIIGKALGGVGGVASEIALGSKGKQAVTTALRTPSAVKSFSKGRTLQNVASDTTKAAQKLSTESKKAFNTAIDMARDDISLTPKRGVSEITKVIRETALDLSPTEKGVVSRAKSLISKWKDWSPKGIIKLRQELDRRGFYRAGNEAYSNSNNSIQAMRSRLNELAISMDDTIAPALEKASFDIQMGNKLGYNLLGKNTDINVEATANRLKMLLRNIDDPIEKEATRELLEFLKTRTGYDLGADLSGLSAFQEFQKPLNSGSIPGIVQSLVKRFAQEPVTGLGSASQAIKGKLPKLGKPGQISPGDALFNSFR